MKIINISILIIMIIIINGFIVFGANPNLPDEPSNTLINKIDSDHKNTRLYMKNQLIEREKSFTTEFTKRADYYENALDDMIKLFIFRVSLVFGGIIVFVSAVNHLIKNKLEKKRYAILLESIKTDVKNDFGKNIKDYLKMPENDINEFNKLNEINQPPIPPVEFTQPLSPTPTPIQPIKKKTSIFSKFKSRGTPQ